MIIGNTKSMGKDLIVYFLLFQLLSPCRNLADGSYSGTWNLIMPNIGISAMHMQLLKNDRVIMFDRTDFGKSNLTLSNSKCRYDENDNALKIDCTAHSLEYDALSNTIRPLTVLTDVWCSSGAVDADGSLVQTGGFNDGDRVVRLYRPCEDCDWQEVKLGLIVRRWYSTNQQLPDGRHIIIGGRKQYNYEFYPKSTCSECSGNQLYNLPFLVESNDPIIENNLYPFVHLNVDGNLFIFANNRAILFDYMKNTMVKRYPRIPGEDPRSYPSSGSSVLLPLKNLTKIPLEAEVMVCGGAPKGSFINAQNGNFIRALSSCARLKITDASPEWVMETMPLGRVMGDMVLLPNGNVLIINGAAKGTAGWDNGQDPVLNPVLFRPNNPNGGRFEIQNPSSIARMYHSTAVLIRDGRVLVGGSNPNRYYNFTRVPYATELSLEAFSPSYLDPEFTNFRPSILSPDHEIILQYGLPIAVRFAVPGVLNRNHIWITMVAPSFNTHSFSMNQRLLVLDSVKLTNSGESTYDILAIAPGSDNLAPSGYYLLFVVHQDIPSEGIWVQIH